MADSQPKATGNPALRMLGLPRIPLKLPSRNWTIFLALSTAVTGSIIYDRREKRKATAKWRHAVEHLAKEPIPGGNPLAMPRKLTIYLSSPPGDGLRVSQDWFTEYVKPVLAASGLDWEFVQGRQQGDIRAVVAERIRKARRRSGAEQQDENMPEEIPTEDERRDVVRRANGIADFDGVRGDLIIGRHTWKEYVRGLHEGWLGPLSPPHHTQHEPHANPAPIEPEMSDGRKEEDVKPEEVRPDEVKPDEVKPEEEDPEQKKPVDEIPAEEKELEEEVKPEKEKKAQEEKKPKRPPQIPAYNDPSDYPAAAVSSVTPTEIGPAAIIPQRHILGFLNTPTRMAWFFNRRAIADEIGREVAAACIATYREFAELPDQEQGGVPKREQETALGPEEKNWVKTVWRDDESQDSSDLASPLPKDKSWVKPIILDPRIATRMRRFELLPEDEARVKENVIPEEEMEGWIKGSLRGLYRRAARKFSKEDQGPKVGNVDEDD